MGRKLKKIEEEKAIVHTRTLQSDFINTDFKLKVNIRETETENHK